MTLIQQDNIWLLWAVVVSMAAFAIFAEQKWKWAATLSAAIIAIFGSMILVNLKLVPAKSDVYTTVTSYILPLSIPLLLFKCDLKKIIKESGKMFLIVNVAALGTMISSLICGLVLKNVPQIQGIMAMQVGAYVGGTVNMVAMGKVFNMDPSYINAAAVVANLFVMIILLFYNFLSVSKWVRKNYPHPHIDAFESHAETGKTLSEQYWKPRPISLRDIAMTLATGVVITGVSQYICQLIAGTTLPDNAKMIIGNVYLVMTTITLVLVTLFPKYFNNLGGAEELGNFMIMLFFVSLGLSADIGLFIAVGPVIIVTAIIIIICNLGLVLAVGKFCKWNIEEIISCSNATIGGPTTAAAFSISKGWTDLVVPGILIGLYGYAIGNYAGVFIASLIH